MGTVIWDGSAQDGNWDTVANWDTGAKPATNDDVIINAGTDDITSGMAQGSVDLSSLYVGPNFKGTIGSAGGPLVIAVSGTGTPVLTYASGGGDSFITAGTNGIDNAEIQHVTEATFYATGGTYVILSTSNRCGPVRVNGTCTVTTLNHTSRSQTGLKATSGVTLTTVWSSGQYLESAANIGTGHISGTIKMTGTARFSTAAYLFRGAKYMKHSSGTDVLVRAEPGSLFSPDGSPAGDYTVTTFQTVEGSTVIKNAPGVAGTFTNDDSIGVDE